MNKVARNRGGLILVLMALLLMWGVQAQAAIVGEAGTTFNLVAKQDHISSPDGDSLLIWGFLVKGAGNRAQYPGPTLIVNEGETITINLTNRLPAEHGQNVSIVFPGQVVTATGGVPGLLTKEAVPDGNVTYQFTATHPGTYLYRSGTRPDLQVEMGLVGALIVRPAMGADHAYNHADTQFDMEFLYLLTEMDQNIHRLVEFGRIGEVDTTDWFPVHWFMNGRAFPDILQDNGVPWFPTQPYNCLPITAPHKRVLIRCIGAGRQLHPMHYHGNDFATIAVNGRLLSSDGGTSGPDLAWKASTINFTPGQTADLIWTWTGENVGWDIYGHAPGDPMVAGEDPDDHGIPVPVILAQRDDLVFGQFYSGSPYLGSAGDLPPDHPGLNLGGWFLFPWHSHSEKELTSNDVFPGGVLTFVILVHPDDL
jgi:FtsP/CotA-like multicopper oxidase with cupredoxin domain